MGERLDGRMETCSVYRCGVNMKKIQGFLCGPRLYKFNGWFFEINAFCGPWPLKKDGDPRKRAGRVFWKIADKFYALSDEEKKQYNVGGGCITF